MRTHRSTEKRAGSSRRLIAAAVILVVLVLILLSGISLYRSKHSLMVSRYEIRTGALPAGNTDASGTSNNSNSIGNTTADGSSASEPLRIVQLSDLHNSEFGMDNAGLIARVAEEKPDLILMTGDIVNANDPNTTISTDLIRALTKVAPVYASMGNHELSHEKNFGDDITKLWEEAGAVVLERNYCDVDINGRALRLAGIYGYCLPRELLETGEARADECAFLEEVQDTDRYTILLCHMPVCWIVNGSLASWDIDCVFSGHVHGGEVILPFGKALHAPDFGWFTDRLEGLYYENETEKTGSVLVLSRGLGTAQRLPRFNNIPQIVSVTID